MARSVRIEYDGAYYHVVRDREEGGRSFRTRRIGSSFEDERICTLPPISSAARRWRGAMSNGD